MADLKIRTFKGAEDPEATITIPLGVLGVATKVLPRKALLALEEKGIDLNAIVELSRQEDIKGTLVEIDDHRKKEKVVISIE